MMNTVQFDAFPLRDLDRRICQPGNYAVVAVAHEDVVDVVAVGRRHC